MDWSIIAASAAGSGLLFFICWIVATLQRDLSLVDRIWGSSFVVHGVVAILHLEHPHFYQWILVSMVGLWGGRLSVYLSIRNWGKGEDYRYQAMRARNGKNYWLTSLFMVYGVQWILSILISFPLFWSLTQTTSYSSMIFWLGSLVWLVGFAFESIGDWQLQKFKKNPQNKGKLLTTGLWKYTRHPNYFGDGLLWWGYFLIALASGGWWTFFGPLLMTLLLRKVSGVDLLEKRLKKTKPEFQSYMENTPAFIPKIW